MNAIFQQKAYYKIAKGSKTATNETNAQTNKQTTEEGNIYFNDVSIPTQEIKAKVILTSLLFSLMLCGSREVKSLQKGIPQM